jgi:3-oxoacyl-[acyl-carrier protein] reductase
MSDKRNEMDEMREMNESVPPVRGTKRSRGETLSGKVVLVTGGGAGIGGAISLVLGKAGAAVMINYLSRKELADGVAKEIRSLGGKSRTVRADVSLPRGARTVVDVTIRSFGRLDILVNNVGSFLHKPILAVKPEEWCGIIQNNLNSVFYCSSQAIPHMRKQGWGRIVNIGVAGCDDIRAFPNTTAYNIAKTGVLILSKSLAREVAPFGITVNVVAPGMVDTGVLSKPAMKKLAERIPMKRAASPEEVARAVVFLISDVASYITGSCITMSGGWLL